MTNIFKIFKKINKNVEELERIKENDRLIKMLENRDTRGLKKWIKSEKFKNKIRYGMILFSDTFDKNNFNALETSFVINEIRRELILNRGMAELFYFLENIEWVQQNDKPNYIG